MNEHYLNERLKRIAGDVLVALAGAGISTPEKGYLAKDNLGWVKHDIGLLMAERDAAIVRAEKAEGEVKDLRERLASFANMYTGLHDDLPGSHLVRYGGGVTIGDIRGARRTLAATTPEPATETEERTAP